MKKCIIILLIFIAFFYTIRSISCPTCVGLPKNGERPFFEHGKVEYKSNNPQTSSSSDNDDDDTETVSTQAFLENENKR